MLEDALSTVFRVPVRIFAAGRTDSGVHATGQVAHVDVPVDALPHAYPRRPRGGDPEFLPMIRRLARFLPEDVRVRAVVRAPVGFDARFSALRRHYVSAFQRRSRRRPAVVPVRRPVASGAG